MRKTTFTLAEAAALLSCHTETLRRAIQDGELRAARLGRGYRVSRLDLQSFWEAQGGGDLFSPEELGTGELSPPVEAARPKAKEKKQQPKGPEQLPLLPE